MKQETQICLRQFLKAISVTTLLVSCSILCLSPTLSHANDNLAITRLKEIQAKVSSVVAQNMKSCVVIADGEGFGSGVIVSEDGLVLTAAHVLVARDRGQYEIILPSGKRVKAKPLGRNLAADCAMCQILEPGPFPFVELEKSNKQKKGDWVVSLGHSGGWDLGRPAPVRSGRIIDQKGHQLLTDAVLIGGDSGGPLFNLEGKLIGIHSSIGDNIAENRHATVAEFVRTWGRLKTGDVWGKLPDLNDPTEKREPGLIGIKLDLTQPNAAIRVVNDGMPAMEIGLEVGDVIKQFDNTIINDGRHLIDVIKRKFAGDVCPIVIERNGKEIRYEIILR